MKLDEFHKNRLKEEGLSQYEPDVLDLMVLYKQITSVPEQEGNFEEVKFDDMILGFFLAKGIVDDMNDRDVDPPVFRLTRLVEWWRWND